MPSGHASHKGTSDKPNPNAPGQIDTATNTEPQDVLSEETTAGTERTQEAVNYPPATQRPSNKLETGSEK